MRRTLYTNEDKNGSEPMVTAKTAKTYGETLMTVFE